MLKENILKALAESRGNSLSGQELATRFAVSRNAVWKAVKSLEAEGITVTAGTNKGYMLEKNTLCRFDVHLSPSVRVFYYDSIDSTNTQAKRLLAEGLVGEAFLFADEQTGGRGRLGRQFYSPKGTGLYYSYVFHPDKSLADAVFITTAAAVSVVRAIEKLSDLRPTIKWVNDVYLGEKKICGILTEAITDFESGRLESVIVGIGVNFNTAVFPAELEGRAAGLNDDSLTRPQLLAALAEELVKVTGDLTHPSIMEDYRAHSLVLGREISFIKNGKQFCGKAVHIEPNGALAVQTDSGLQILSSGEISVIL